MIELSNEAIERMLHKETVKKEETGTILRGVYTRYMLLYEKYFADIDALNDDVIARLRHDHEETRSLVKYYYMDIPMDVCTRLDEFDEKYSASLLGPAWREFLAGAYLEFRESRSDENMSREALKAEFSKQTLKAFYDDMNYVFRDGFGTGSKTAEKVVGGLVELFFGKEK